jgi:hypothetical protein
MQEASESYSPITYVISHVSNLGLYLVMVNEGYLIYVTITPAFSDVIRIDIMRPQRVDMFTPCRTETDYGNILERPASLSLVSLTQTAFKGFKFLLGVVASMLIVKGQRDPLKAI